MSRILGSVDAPDESHIRRNAEHFQELLQIRTSSPLFRLQSAQEVQDVLSFFNTGPKQVPGVIAMHLEDVGDLDAAYQSITVVFNSSPSLQRLNAEALGGKTLQLHPVQRSSGDDLVKFSRARADGTLIVPGRTTAVFVEPAR